MVGLSGANKKQPHASHRIVKAFQKAVTTGTNPAQLYFHCDGLFLADQIFISYMNISQLLALFLLYFSVLSDILYLEFNIIFFYFLCHVPFELLHRKKKSLVDSCHSICLYYCTGMPKERVGENKCTLNTNR